MLKSSTVEKTDFQLKNKRQPFLMTQKSYEYDYIRNNNNDYNNLYNERVKTERPSSLFKDKSTKNYNLFNDKNSNNIKENHYYKLMVNLDKRK